MTYLRFNARNLIRMAGIPLLFTVIAGCSSIEDPDEDGDNGGGVISRTLNESTTTNIDVGGEVSDVTEILGLDAVTINSSGTAIEVRISDLQVADATARYELTIETAAEDNQSEGGEEDQETSQRSVILDLEVINTSAEPIVAEAQALLRAEDGVSPTVDDVRLIEIFIDLNYFTGTINFGERTNQIEEMQTSLQELETALSEEFPTLRTEFDSFQSGETTELDLSSAIDRVDTAVNNLNNAATAELASRSSVARGLGLDFPININGDLPLVYVDELERYTRYADADLGDFNQENDFIFNAENDFLNAVFTFEAPDAPDEPEAPVTMRIQ